MFILGVCIVAGFGVASVVSVGGGGQYCYSCHGVRDSGSCTFTTQCKHDEYCGAEVTLEHDGSTQLRLDCFSKHDCEHQGAVLIGRRRRQAGHHGVTCSQCCATDNCNKQLCGGHIQTPTNPVLPVVSPNCYSCRHEVSHPAFCNDVDTCKHDERCGMDEHVGHHGLLSYKLGCKHEHDCSHDNHDGCTQCCYGHLCNKNLCSATPLIQQTTTTKATTVSTTVPTTAAATTAAPTVAPTTTKPLINVPTGEPTMGPACVNVEEHGFSCDSFDQFNFCTDTTSFAHALAHTNCRLHCHFCTLQATTTVSREERHASAVTSNPMQRDRVRHGK